MARNNDDGRDRLWTGEFSTFWTEPASWETGSRRLAVHYVDCGVGCQAHIIRCPMMSSPSTPTPFHQAASSWRWRRPMAGQCVASVIIPTLRHLSWLPGGSVIQPTDPCYGTPRLTEVEQ